MTSSSKIINIAECGSYRTIKLILDIYNKDLEKNTINSLLYNQIIYLCDLSTRRGIRDARYMFLLTRKNHDGQTQDPSLDGAAAYQYNILSTTSFLN